MRVVLIDNYDSFTFNLYQLLGGLGAEVLVRRNDEVTSAGIAALRPTHLVLSPGPGRPDRPRDFGVCADAIRDHGPRLPLLGVCLGHQGIVHVLGGRVVAAPSVVHGKSSPIRHCGEGLYASLPERPEVMRYHSLVAERDSLPASLRITAETDDGVVMGVAHRSWPVHGVQFHPESIGTPDGSRVLANFLSLDQGAR